MHTDQVCLDSSEGPKWTGWALELRSAYKSVILEAAEMRQGRKASRAHCKPPSVEKM